MTDQSRSAVVVGRIGKPFGLDGAVYVFSDPDLDDPIVTGAVCQAGDQALTVLVAKRHKDRLVVSFEGINSREDAELVRGAILTLPAAQVAIAEDMIWVSDLQGRQVVDGDGALVGVVETVTDGHAHDYLVIARPDGGQATIPMVEELVDWATDPIVVTPPTGLLDPDEAW